MKNEVKTEVVKGMLRLRWRVDSERFCLNLGLSDNKINRIKANKIGSTIELDKLSGHFDRSLVKYGKKIKLVEVATISNLENLDIVATFDIWVSTLDNQTQHHRAYRSWLVRESVTWVNLCERLLDCEVALDTWNKRFRISLKILDSRPDRSEVLKNFTGLKYPGLKLGKVYNPTRQPFNIKEIKLILSYIDQNHSHYFLFTEMLFFTGCRPSEIIGLRKKDFEDNFSKVIISESLPRTAYGKGDRIRKGTKTNTIRTLKIESELANHLCQISHVLEPDELLFKSVNGKPIDDRNYLKRIWKPTLLALKLPYRVPYACRHTMASRALENGLSPIAVAHMMGHSSPTLVLERYGHVISQPDLPSLL